jgi:hypothetical protein
MPAFPRPVTIHDISENGCRLELRGAPLELGGTALLEVPGLPKIAGRIVWSHGNLAGVQFERTLSRHAARALGLDVPDPEPAVEESIEPAKPEGLLRHWFRRLSRRFA